MSILRLGLHVLTVILISKVGSSWQAFSTKMVLYPAHNLGAFSHALTTAQTVNGLPFDKNLTVGIVFEDFAGSFQNKK